MTHVQASAWRATARRPVDLVSLSLTIAVVACLATDAYVHLTNAADYGATTTSVLSQATLFRADGVVAVLAALALLIRRSRATWAAAAVVLATGFGAVALYTYVDVGRIGPIPNMYEPTWALPGKTASAWGEGTGIMLSLLGLLAAQRRHQSAARRPPPPDPRLTF
jgi:hypothetical protein